jgi:hypothetical protein
MQQKSQEAPKVGHGDWFKVFMDSKLTPVNWQLTPDPHLNLKQPNKAKEFIFC